MVLGRGVKLHWLQLVAHTGALAALAWLVWQYAQGLFVVDPVREITTFTGKAALILLLLSLACTPFVTLTGYEPVRRLSRPLGMYAFLFAALHFLTFVALDYGFDLGLIGEAIFAQRYVVAGFGAGLILLALALTSSKGWQKRLGKAWKRLHRLVYLAGVLVVLHLLWLSKDPGAPLRYGAVLAMLLALRIPRVRQSVCRMRRQLGRSVASWAQAIKIG